MKQSSIEWLISEIQRHNDAGYEFNPKHEEEIIEQAEQMHKGELKQAFLKNDDSISIETALERFEKYYNETFKSE